MSWRARVVPSLSSCLIMMNSKDPQCFGVRSWLRNNIPEINLLNPGFRFSCQETSFGEPTMFLMYSSTNHRIVRLPGTTEEEMDEIMEAAVSYGIYHSMKDAQRADDGIHADGHQTVINFGYTESFNSRLENSVKNLNGVELCSAAEDPGQRPRKLSRNLFRILP